MKKLVLQLVFSGVMRNFLRAVVGLRFKRAVFLRSENQFVIVANHNSHLDTMALMAALPRRIVHRVRPVAAADHFGRTGLKRNLSNYFINTLLIERKRHKDDPARDPIHLMIEALDQGYSLILFPEGTRGEPEKMQPLRPGVAMVLAARPHIPFVPAYLKGMGKAWPKGERMFLPYNGSLTFGRPRRIAGASMGEILAEVEAAILALQE